VKVLPCGWTVCDRHIRNNDLVNCPGCHANHSQHKEHRYPVNKTIDLQLKLYETNENLNRAFVKFADFKNAYNDPFGYINQFFEQLIELTFKREDEVIESVHAHFESVRDHVNERRNRYLATEHTYKTDKVRKFKRMNVKRLEDDLNNFKKKTEMQIQDKNVLTNFNLEESLKETNEKVTSIQKSITDSLTDLLNKDAYQLTSRSNYINYEKIFGELTVKEKVICFSLNLC
jgi:hypothetical protein